MFGRTWLGFRSPCSHWEGAPQTSRLFSGAGAVLCKTFGFVCFPLWLLCNEYASFG